jgi:hypothetical protein
VRQRLPRRRGTRFGCGCVVAAKTRSTLNSGSKNRRSRIGKKNTVITSRKEGRLVRVLLPVVAPDPSSQFGTPR